MQKQLNTFLISLLCIWLEAHPRRVASDTAGDATNNASRASYVSLVYCITRVVVSRRRVIRVQRYMGRSRVRTCRHQNDNSARMRNMRVWLFSLDSTALQTIKPQPSHSTRGYLILFTWKLLLNTPSLLTHSSAANACVHIWLKHITLANTAMRQHPQEAIITSLQFNRNKPRKLSEECNINVQLNTTARLNK